MAHFARVVPEAPPTFDNLTPTSIIAETNSISILNESLAIRDQLASDLFSSTATFAKLIGPLADDVNRAACRLRMLGTLAASGSPDQHLREASRAAEKLILADEAASKMGHDIAALVDSVHKSLSQSKVNEDRDSEMDAEDSYLLAHMFGAYYRAGFSIRTILHAPEFRLQRWS